MKKEIEYVIKAIKTGKSVFEILGELRGKKISADERWYIDLLLRNYDHERQTQELKQEYREGRQEYREGTERMRQEYREGTERIVAKINNAEEHIIAGFDRLGERFGGVEKALGEYAGEINGLIKGLLLGRGYRGEKNEK